MWMIIMTAFMMCVISDPSFLKKKEQSEISLFEKKYMNCALILHWYSFKR